MPKILLAILQLQHIDYTTSKYDCKVLHGTRYAITNRNSNIEPN